VVFFNFANSSKTAGKRAIKPGRVIVIVMLLELSHNRTFTKRQVKSLGLAEMYFRRAMAGPAVMDRDDNEDFRKWEIRKINASLKRY
jgi:hypothetical protein